jgi:hypothetical protein
LSSLAAGSRCDGNDLLSAEEGYRLRSYLMRRLAVFAFVAVALVVAGAGLAVSRTRLERWVAFRAGQPAAGVRVLVRADGSCVSGSFVDPRSDAWRCLTGGQIQDPCFSGGGSFLLCPYGTPDSRDALRLRLTKPLPERRANLPSEAAAGDPWVIETRGLFCYRTTGSSMILARRRLTYECAGASALAGRPNRTGSVWTISLLPTSISTHYTTVEISSAWW